VNDRDRQLLATLDQKLVRFSATVHPLAGLDSSSQRTTFLAQLVDSIHRVKYPKVISARKISASVTDPDIAAFDPLKAAIYHFRDGNIDEACWLVFLFVHFGKHRKGKWRYITEVYGRIGSGTRWDWNQVSADVGSFRKWLGDNEARIRRPNVPGGFGNHRKYESLNADKDNGTGATVESYVGWVLDAGSHERLLQSAIQKSDGDTRIAFDNLYRSMSAVRRFGRTAKFDYLAMLGKLGFADVEPGATYMKDAKGPLEGARLLVANDKLAPLSAHELEKIVAALDADLNIGMQAMEDALCNWQKNPTTYCPFVG
jgi:hypothetical protein